jgi:5,10-methenyltetrahydrofolate synthetase
MNGDDTDRAAIMAWRRDTRHRLIEERLKMPVAARQAASRRICDKLDALLPVLHGQVVSGYWPLRGEPDIRPWLGSLVERGVTCAMPLVVEKGAALRFRSWHPGCRMEKGFWDIPVPADGEWVTPTVLLAPVVGFDDRHYRLGYGGGYFDRTLAALPGPWQAIGVGYVAAKLESFVVLPHDVRLQEIVVD